MKREQEDLDSELSSRETSNVDNASSNTTTPTETNGNMAKRRRTGINPSLAEVIERPHNSLEKINMNEVDVEQAMTQVDERWNKNRRRRRTIEKMTQAPVGAHLIPDDESPSESGVIEKLELYNFMCHKAFSLKLGPQTNFIIGSNGSGKSAVLTGISVALGAKATDTDRGSSLKNLIMHGKNVARAIVTLMNEGPEAYKPEEFGPRIIIERTIKMEGSHTLKIKNSENKVISTTRATVDAILEYFGITIANPMTILTQTEAKTFLAHSTDKDKFNSFMSGTRLKESFDNIKNIESNTNEIRDILGRNKTVHEEKKAKFREAKKVWNSFRDSDEYSKKKELLIGKKIWVEYKENEKLYSKAAELLEKKKAEIVENESKKSSITEDIITMEKAKEELENGLLENYKQKYLGCKEEKDDLKSRITDAKEEIDEINRKISNIKSNIDDSKKLLAKIEKDIGIERKKIEGSSEENIERLKAFQDKQKEKLAELNRQKEELSSNMEVIKGELGEVDRKKRNAVSGMNNEIRNLENKMRDAKQQEHSNRPESAFTQNMIKLIRDIQSQRFQATVLGPLGLHVELKKDFQKWNPVLESILQRTLISFLVSNHRDAQNLSSRVKFFGTGSEITVRQPEVFDYTQYTPQSQYPSILDALKVDDENLKCFLVDSLKLHSTLLVPNRIDAQRELENDNQNLISSIICFVDNNILRLYKKNGAFQSDPVNIGNGNNSVARLRIEGDSLTLRLERDLQEIKKNRDEKLKEFEDKSQHYRSELKTLQNSLSDIKRQSREISQSIEKTDDKLESLTVGTSKLESFVEEKESIEANLSLEVQRLEPIQAALHKAQKGLENQIGLYKSISEDYNNSRKIYEKKLKELNGFDSNIEFGKGNIRTLDSNNVRLESDVAKLSDYLTKTSEVMRTLEVQANEFCSLEEAQLHAGVTTKSIDEEISSINRYLEEIENRQGITKEQAELNLISANSELKEIETKFSDTIGLYNKLCNALESRLNNLLQTTYLTFQEVESVFISALRIRRFRGKIEFNVKKGTLTLKVATKETAPLRSVESFSGGEKSYGQIAFLFAIWGPMHSRVRGLDEFDVFMDNINRRIALKLILSKVAENPKRQTIFITPLGVANVEGLDKKTVYIHEISPPERANA